MPVCAVSGQLHIFGGFLCARLSMDASRAPEAVLRVQPRQRPPQDSGQFTMDIDRDLALPHCSQVLAPPGHAVSCSRSRCYSLEGARIAPRSLCPESRAWTLAGHSPSNIKFARNSGTRDTWRAAGFSVTQPSRAAPSVLSTRSRFRRRPLSKREKSTTGDPNQYLSICLRARLDCDTGGRLKSQLHISRVAHTLHEGKHDYVRFNIVGDVT
jgi:hypothetical protein